MRLFPTGGSSGGERTLGFLAEVLLQWTFEPSGDWQLLNHSSSFTLLIACLPACLWPFQSVSFTFFFAVREPSTTKPNSTFVLENFYQKVILTTLCIYSLLQTLKGRVPYLSTLHSAMFLTSLVYTSRRAFILNCEYSSL